MLETTRYMVLAVAVGLAILGVAVAPGLTASNAAAQIPPGNTTTTPGSNETSSMPPSGNETSQSSNGTSAAAPAGNETTLAESITLKPASGGTGTNVTIDGTGFSPGQTFRFTFDDRYILTGNMIQFATGEFSITALIPANATDGDHEIKAASSAGENATATFTVQGMGGNSTAGNTTALQQAPPSDNETLPAPPGNETAAMPGNVTASTPGIGIASIVLTQTSVNSGGELDIVGSSFGSGQNVTLAIDGNSLDTNSTIKTSASGSFTISTTIPANVTAGDHEIIATDDSGANASAMFSVTEAPMMPPSPHP